MNQALHSLVCVAVLALAVLLLPGCATGFRANTAATQSSPQPADAAAGRLVYRTASDRLNLLAQPAGGDALLVSYEAQQRLPPLTTATLEIRTPHPAGIDGAALVAVAFDAEPADGQRREIWTLDVPAWQLETIVARLRELGFYHRSAVLGAQSHLATELSGVRFGKQYREVPELDALLLRVRQEGRLLGSQGDHFGGPVRLPAVTSYGN